MYTLVGDHRVPAELAQLPLDDYFNADGLAVVVRLYRAAPWRLDARLRELAAALAAPAGKLHYALNPGRVSRDLAVLIRDNRFYDGLAIIAVTPCGDGARTVLALRENPEPNWSRGARGTALTAGTAHYPCTAAAALPFVHAPWGRAAAAEADADADGGLVLDADGGVLFAAYRDGLFLGEAGASAVFAVDGGALITPDPEKNHLPANSLRDAVEELAAREGIVVYHEPLTPDVLARAEEIFTADGAREIRPLRYCRAAAGAPGRTFTDWPLTLRLQLALQKLLEREIAGYTAGV